MAKTTLSVIIPVYNEADTIDTTLKRVYEAPLPTDWEKEVVVINDGSTDATSTRLASHKNRCTIVDCEQNGGKGRAIKEGLLHTNGDYILIQDADQEYDPNDYEKLLAPIVRGETMVVFGSRTLGGNNVSYSRVYYYGGLLLTKLFNICFGSSLTDLATCYKVFPQAYRYDLAAVPSNDFVYDVIDLTHYLASRHQIFEVPISYRARSTAKGKKLHFKHGVRCFIRIGKLYVQKNPTPVERIVHENN